MPIPLKVLVTLAGLLAGPGAEAPAPRVPAEEVVGRLLACNTRSCNATLRAMRAAGLEPALSDPAVIEALRSMLDHPATLLDRQRAILAIRAAGIRALAPELMRTARRDDVAPLVRRNAVLASLVLDPRSDQPATWIKDVVSGGSFRTWSAADRGLLVELVVLLPPDAAAACAESIGQWADEAHLGSDDVMRQALVRAQSEIRWGRKVEAMVGDAQVQAIVTEGSRRVQSALRLTLDPRRRPLVVDTIHKALADGISPQQSWLIDLLDRIGEPMNDDEFKWREDSLQAQANE